MIRDVESLCVMDGWTKHHPRQVVQVHVHHEACTYDWPEGLILPYVFFLKLLYICLMSTDEICQINVEFNWAFQCCCEVLRMIVIHITLSIFCNFQLEQLIGPSTVRPEVEEQSRIRHPVLIDLERVREGEQLESRRIA